MENYLIETASVYEGVRKTDGGKYHWTVASLMPLEGPKPSRGYPITFTNEDESMKFWRCAKPSTVPNDPRLLGRSETTKVADFRYEDAMEEVNKAKDLLAKAQTDPTVQIPKDTLGIKYVFSMDPEGFTSKRVLDYFFIATNIKLLDKEIGYNVARIATRPTQVKLVTGQTLNIQPGQFIPGKNGQIPVVTKLRMAIQCDNNGEPLESVEETMNRILESQYRRLDAIPATAPSGAPASNAEAEEARKQEEEAREKTTEEAARAFGVPNLG